MRRRSAISGRAGIVSVPGPGGTATGGPAVVAGFFSPLLRRTSGIDDHVEEQPPAHSGARRWYRERRPFVSGNPWRRQLFHLRHSRDADFREAVSVVDPAGREDPLGA